MPAAVQTCPRCKFKPQQWVNDCPQCGQVIVSPRRVRTLGWLLIVIGAFLSVGMAAVGMAVARAIEGPGDPGATTTFTGTGEQMGMMFTLFAFVFLFGLVAMAVGGWQVRTGKQNPRLAGLAFIFFMMFMGLVAYIQLSW
jgi:hypothetical protein